METVTSLQLPDIILILSGISKSLGKLENTEYTRRGEAYIDGIAKTYEARNYISLLTFLLPCL